MFDNIEDKVIVKIEFYVICMEFYEVVWIVMFCEVFVMM